MPSPFPGMDPFIEGQDWEDFHTRVITALADSLLPGVRPRYVVRVERRVYLCLLYTSPSPRDRQKSRMPSSA